jgi:hypothetical protein
MVLVVSYLPVKSVQLATCADVHVCVCVCVGAMSAAAAAAGVANIMSRTAMVEARCARLEG